MSVRRFCIVLLALIGAGTLGIYLCGLSLRPYRLMVPEDYLANLRENTEFGVASFLDRRAEVLVLGDSHSYAAFDFNTLAAVLGTQSISSCAMGGAYTATIPMVARAMREERYSPRIIIYGASLRQFLHGQNREAQLSEHKRMLETARRPDLRTAAGNLFRYAQHSMTGHSGYARSWDADRRELAFHAPLVAQLRSQQLGRTVLGSGLPALVAWDRIIQAASIAAGTQEDLQALCALAHKAGAELHVVVVPESPLLEALYPRVLRDEFHARLAPLGACATSLTALPAGAYDLADEHFINRSMAINYDYEKWGRKGFLPGLGDFDPDHMNLVGAQLFSTFVAQRIREASMPLHSQNPTAQGSAQ